MKKLWPSACAPIHLHLGAPLLYGMLRAVTAACSVSGCFEACVGGGMERAAGCARLLRGEGGEGGAGESVYATRGGCRALRMLVEARGGGGAQYGATQIVITPNAGLKCFTSNKG